MDVVWHHLECEEVPVVACAHATNCRFHIVRQWSDEYLHPRLWYPHEVVVEIVFAVPSFAHARMIGP